MSALQQLYAMVGNNENVLWSGRPNLKCFLLEAVFNPFLPFALIWLLFDSFFIAMLFFADNGQAVTKFPLAHWGVLAFFTLHLMPVWIYLGGVVFSYLKYKHTAFLVTDKNVYISGGIFSITYTQKPLAEVSYINLHRGMVDQFLGVGDIVFSNPQENRYAGRSRNLLAPGPLAICDIPDYQEVYTLIKGLVQHH